MEHVVLWTNSSHSRKNADFVEYLNKGWKVLFVQPDHAGNIMWVLRKG